MNYRLLAKHFIKLTQLNLLKNQTKLNQQIVLYKWKKFAFYLLNKNLNEKIVKKSILIENKTIYMTYKKQIPTIVKDRWKKLNPSWDIQLSLDNDCIIFLKENFNEYVSCLFNKIQQGMYKADLWRLCKLYQHGGVYTDVDIIPYLNLDTLDKDISFYTTLNGNSIFQAFIKCSKPKSPLIFIFLLSFLLNSPYNSHNGPCSDMYNCIKYNIQELLSDKKYNLKQVKIKIDINCSQENTKIIDLYYFPESIKYVIELHKSQYPDTFDITIKNTQLIVTRTDSRDGWGYPHKCDIIIDCNETLFFFNELSKGQWMNSYVNYNNVKILDSHDHDYINKLNGWKDI